MTQFVAGFAVGAWVFWNASAAWERFRRARSDFQATRRGLRTLVEMMFSRMWQAVQGILLAGLVLAGVFWFWQHRGFR